jgi:glycine/D-amino acid oxidase-like deaminating enzyme
MAQWQTRDAPVDWLDKADIARQTGSEEFKGGWVDRRAGKIHPLKFAYALTRAARDAGARIYSRSPVTLLERRGASWRAIIGAGVEVAADCVLLASNAYTAHTLRSDLPRMIVPANSFQVATRPLDTDQLVRILPGGTVVSESRRVGTHFRIGPENRLLIGGRHLRDRLPLVRPRRHDCGSSHPALRTRTRPACSDRVQWSRRGIGGRAWPSLRDAFSR